MLFRSVSSVARIRRRLHSCACIAHSFSANKHQSRNKFQRMAFFIETGPENLSFRSGTQMRTTSISSRLVYLPIPPGIVVPRRFLGSEMMVTRPPRRNEAFQTTIIVCPRSSFPGHFISRLWFHVRMFHLLT